MNNLWLRSCEKQLRLYNACKVYDKKKKEKKKELIKCTTVLKNRKNYLSSIDVKNLKRN